jgi:hypothetical protein
LLGIRIFAMGFFSPHAGRDVDTQLRMLFYNERACLTIASALVVVWLFYAHPDRRRSPGRIFRVRSMAWLRPSREHSLQIAAAAESTGAPDRC